MLYEFFYVEAFDYLNSKLVWVIRGKSEDYVSRVDVAMILLLAVQI
jgi:hypothetical protein